MLHNDYITRNGGIYVVIHYYTWMYILVKKDTSIDI